MGVEARGAKGWPGMGVEVRGEDCCTRGVRYRRVVLKLTPSILWLRFSVSAKAAGNVIEGGSSGGGDDGINDAKGG